MTTGRIAARARTCPSALMQGVLLVGCAVTVSVSAADFAYDVSLTAGHSDNIGLVPTNEQEEDIAAAGLSFSLGQKSARLEADAVGNFSYVEYLDNTYDSDLLGNFAGNARFQIVPQRLTWSVADNFGQVLSDPFSPPTPANRENVNYFTTGPDLTMAFGSQSRLRVGGRYALATYEDLDLDFDTLSGSVVLERSLSEASTVSLNFSAASTEYDNTTIGADYEQQEAFVRYDVTGARTALAIDLGYTAIDGDAVNDEKQDGLLLRLDATRRITPSSTARLAVGREFANSATAFAGLQSVGGIGLGTTPGLQTTQPFTNDSATLTWDFSRNRTGVGVFAYWSDQSYEGVAAVQDQTLTTYGTQFTRQMSPRTSLSVLAQHTQAEFDVPNSDYDELTGGLGFSWQMSKSVSLTAAYDYFRRSSDQFAGADAVENRFTLSIAYGRGELRNRLAGPEFAVDTGR
jgi:hypothetical protein